MSTEKSHRFVAAIAIAGVMAIALAAVLVADPWPGHARARGPMTERFIEHSFERLAEYLELSEAQRTEAEALRERWLGDVHERFEANAASFEQIHEMAAAENPDATAVGERVIQVHREREVMRAAHEGYRAELVKLLTPEQAEKLDAWEAARHQREGCGPHQWHGGPHGDPSHAPDAD